VANKVTLSFIVLNYKDVPLTTRCIRAISDSMVALSFQWEAVVVDNSAMESGESLRAALSHFPVRVIDADGNLGLAKANNLGAHLAKGDYLVLLNNDAFVNSAAIEAGVEALKADPRIAIWASALKGNDGRLQASVGELPRLRHLLSEYAGIRLFHSNRAEIPADQSSFVDSVVGAFMIISSGIYQDAGGFDEDYFFTCEDVDLCKRMRDAGFKVMYDPRFHVVHIGGASQGWKWIHDPFLHSARVMYFRKNHGILIGFCAWAIIWPSLYARRFLRRVKGRND